MLQSEDISRIEEIRTFFKNNWLELPVLFLPILGLRSVNQAVNSTLEQTNKKDVYYRKLANQNINWRSLLLLINKRYLLTYYLEVEPSRYQNKLNWLE